MSAPDAAIVDTFLNGMPKAELHMHVEGSLEPEMMFEIARRNGVSLRYASVEEVRRAYDFTDLQSFLDVYYEATRVLLHERDFSGRTSRRPPRRAYATRRSSSTPRLTPTAGWPSRRRSRAYAGRCSTANEALACPRT